MRGDSHIRFTFFLVANEKIINEQVNLSETLDQPLREDIFEKIGYSDTLWRNHEYYSQAHDIWWHRKFIRDSKTGQIFNIKEHLQKSHKLKNEDILDLILFINPIFFYLKLIAFILIVISLLVMVKL